MATLTESTTIDQTNFVGEFEILHIRWATEIMRDGEVISTSYHRATYAPGSDITHLPQEIQDAAAAMWTQEVIDAYNAAQQSTP